MDLRLALYELSARHSLSAEGAARLAEAAGLQQPPASLHPRLAQGVAVLAAALGGLDALVFTAGIGEHSVRIRQEVCARLAWLGVSLDPKRNQNPGSGPVMLAAASSAVRVWRIPTDEERRIAMHTAALLNGHQD